jgi:hypothetical protein
MKPVKLRRGESFQLTFSVEVVEDITVAEDIMDDVIEAMYRYFDDQEGEVMISSGVESEWRVT